MFSGTCTCNRKTKTSVVSVLLLPGSTFQGCVIRSVEKKWMQACGMRILRSLACQQSFRIECMWWSSPARYLLQIITGQVELRQRSQLLQVHCFSDDLFRKLKKIAHTQLLESSQDAEKDRKVADVLLLIDHGTPATSDDQRLEMHEVFEFF